MKPGHREATIEDVRDILEAVFLDGIPVPPPAAQELISKERVLELFKKWDKDRVGPIYFEQVVAAEPAQMSLLKGVD